MCPKISFKFQVSSLKLRASPALLLNVKLETLNFKRHAQRGFTMPTAIFLVVILAMLGVFIISVTGLQSSSQTLDVQGVRAYQAARAGIEWGAYQVLDPNNNQLGIGGTPNLPICPAPSTNLAMPAGSSLSIFTVTVQCNAALNAPTTEGNRSVGAYRIIANACNQPSGGSCPNPAPASGYVERQFEAVLSKCKDPTAAAPQFACG